MAANQVPGFDDMHDIVLSEPVSWWPLAPGWYVLMLIAAMAAIWFGVKCWRRWKANQYRRDALLELNGIAPQDLPALVKRVCLSAWPRDEVANLSGEAWMKFLDQSGNTTDFTQGSGKLLLDLSYNPHSQIHKDSAEFHQLTEIVRQWISQR